MAPASQPVAAAPSSAITVPGSRTANSVGPKAAIDAASSQK